jgi:hypothetical protein
VLGEQAQTVATPPQNCDQIAAPAAEYKYVAAGGMFDQGGLHERTQRGTPRRMSVMPAASQT